MGAQCEWERGVAFFGENRQVFNCGGEHDAITDRAAGCSGNTAAACIATVLAVLPDATQINWWPVIGRCVVKRGSEGVRRPHHDVWACSLETHLLNRDDKSSPPLGWAPQWLREQMLPEVWSAKLLPAGEFTFNGASDANLALITVLQSWEPKVLRGSQPKYNADLTSTICGVWPLLPSLLVKAGTTLECNVQWGSRQSNVTGQWPVLIDPIWRTQLYWPKTSSEGAVWSWKMNLINGRFSSASPTGDATERELHDAWGGPHLRSARSLRRWRKLLSKRGVHGSCGYRNLSAPEPRSARAGILRHVFGSSDPPAVSGWDDISLWWGSAASVFHAHFDFEEALAVQLSGEKIYVLWPPEDILLGKAPPIYPNGHPLFRKAQSTGLGSLASGGARLRGVQNAVVVWLKEGDTVLLPFMWMHHTVVLPPFNYSGGSPWTLSGWDPRAAAAMANVSITAVLRSKGHPLTAAWHSLNGVLDDLERVLSNRSDDILGLFYREAAVDGSLHEATEKFLGAACFLWLALAADAFNAPPGSTHTKSRLGFWSRPLPLVRWMVERSLWPLVPDTRELRTARRSKETVTCAAADIGGVWHDVRTRMWNRLISARAALDAHGRKRPVPEPLQSESLVPAMALCSPDAETTLCAQYTLMVWAAAERFPESVLYELGRKGGLGAPATSVTEQIKVGEVKDSSSHNVPKGFVRWVRWWRSMHNGCA